jgi:Zn-dependent membrane protease YugP
VAQGLGQDHLVLVVLLAEEVQKESVAAVGVVEWDVGQSTVRGKNYSFLELASPSCFLSF